MSSKRFNPYEGLDECHNCGGMFDPDWVEERYPNDPQCPHCHVKFTNNDNPEVIS